MAAQFRFLLILSSFVLGFTSQQEAPVDVSASSVVPSPQEAAPVATPPQEAAPVAPPPQVAAPVLTPPQLTAVRNNTESYLDPGSGSGGEEADDAESRSNGNSGMRYKKVLIKCLKPKAKGENLIFDTWFQDTQRSTDDGFVAVTQAFANMFEMFRYNTPGWLPREKEETPKQWALQRYNRLEAIKKHVIQNVGNVRSASLTFPLSCYSTDEWMNFKDYFTLMISHFDRFILDKMKKGIWLGKCEPPPDFGLRDYGRFMLAHSIVFELFGYMPCLESLAKEMVKNNLRTDRLTLKEHVQQLFVSNIEKDDFEILHQVTLHFMAVRNSKFIKQFYKADEILCPAAKADEPQCRIFAFLDTVYYAFHHIDSSHSFCDLGYSLFETKLIFHLWMVVPPATDGFLMGEITNSWVDEMRPKYKKEILQLIFDRVSGGDLSAIVVLIYKGFRKRIRKDCEEIKKVIHTPTEASGSTPCIFAELFEELATFSENTDYTTYSTLYTDSWYDQQAKILVRLILTPGLGKHIDVSLNDVLNSIGSHWEERMVTRYYKPILNVIFRQVSIGNSEFVKYIAEKSIITGLKEKLELTCTSEQSSELKAHEAKSTVPCVFSSLLTKLTLFAHTDESNSEYWQAAILVFMMTTETHKYLDFNNTQANDWFDKVFNFIFFTVTNNRIDELDNLLSKLPDVDELSIKDNCKDYTFAIKLPCLLHGILRQLNVYKDTKKSLQLDIATTSGKTRSIVLDIKNNWKARLEQYKIDAMAGALKDQLIALESTFLEETNEIKKFTSDKLEENFVGLQEYFQGVSSFDKRKSELDVQFIVDRLKYFDDTSRTLGEEVRKNLCKIVKMFLGNAAIQVGEAAIQASLKALNAANPLDPDPAAILEAREELQASVSTLITAKIVRDEFEKSVAISKEIALKFRKNSDFLKDVRGITNKLQSKETNNADFVSQTNNFLQSYEDYDPQVKKEEIVDMADQWETFMTTACEKLMDMNKAVSGVVSTLQGKHELCLTKHTLAKLMTLYEEIYDYQDQLMNSLAGVVRAHMSIYYAGKIHSKLDTAKELENMDDKKDWKLLENTINRINFFLSYRQVLYSAAGEYCNLLAYRNAGEPPSECVTGLDKLEAKHVSDIIECNLPAFATKSYSVRIPTAKSSETGPHGFINLTQLYKGEEVTFQIPRRQWLLDNDWIAGDWDQDDRAFYIFKFKPIITVPDYTGQIAFDVTARSAVPVVQAEQEKKHFVIQPDKYSPFSYRQDDKCNVLKQIVTKDRTICQTSHDEESARVNYEVKPSAFSLWKIKLTTQLQNPPRVTPASTMQAYIEIRSKSRSKKINKKKLKKKLRR